VPRYTIENTKQSELRFRARRRRNRGVLRARSFLALGPSPAFGLPPRGKLIDATSCLGNGCCRQFACQAIPWHPPRRLLARRFRFLCVSPCKPHPGDGAPWAEDPIGYAYHRVDYSEVPHVAQNHPELFAVWPMDNDLLADPCFGHAIFAMRADPIGYIPVCHAPGPSICSLLLPLYPALIHLELAEVEIPRT
jgi:hypothetical protein